MTGREPGAASFHGEPRRHRGQWWATIATRMPIPPTNTPPREVRGDDKGYKPLLAVWEVTLRCDQTCAHCGSRAGKARVDELSTHEMLDVARALVRLGCREVALIGGEAYL